MRLLSRHGTGCPIYLNRSGGPRVMMTRTDCSPTSLRQLKETSTGVLAGSGAISLAGRNSRAESHTASGSPLLVVFLVVVTALITLLMPAPSSAQGLHLKATPMVSTPYAQWSNYPQNPSFFPLVVWLQNPTRTLGTGAPYSTVAAAAVGTKINTFLGLDNGGVEWAPTSFGSGDPGGLVASIKANGLYFIPQINTKAGGGTPNNTDVNSIASIKAAAASLGATSNLLGWNMGDEPQGGSCTTWPLSAIPGQVTTLTGYDSTRPIFLNSTDYVFMSGYCSPVSLNTNYMAAMSIAGYDQYPVTNPWIVGCCSGTAKDLMWEQGYSVNQMRSVRAAGAPMWAFVDTGTDELSASSSNGSVCNYTTNLCSAGNEARATSVQVNAEVWMSIINGATGIEYFCHDSVGPSFCFGQGGSAVALAVQANLTYVNTTILAYAPMINSPVAGICTMNNGTAYTSFTTSCSNGSLKMLANTATVPGSALLTNDAGTYYLFAQPGRKGSGTFTFTLTGLPGYTATVVYDSNSKYDTAHNSTGTAFTLNGSAQFTDSLGGNGDDYQVKIYEVH